MNCSSIDVQEYLPLGSYMLVEMTESLKKTDLGLIIPDSAQKFTQDGLVLLVGERCKLVQPGNRIVAGTRNHFEFLEATLRHAVIAEENIIGIYRDQAHAVLDPAPGYVLVRPRPIPTVSKGGIAISYNSLPGGDSRESRRGEELYKELITIGDSEKWRSQPTEYDKHRVVWDFLEGLSKREISVLGDTIRRNGDTRWDGYEPLARRYVSMSGMVVRTAPTETPMVQCGDLVHWESRFEGFAVSEGGNPLLIIKESLLCAVEIPDDQDVREKVAVC